MGLILFLVSKVLILALYPIGFLYSILTTFVKEWYYNGLFAAMYKVDRYLFKCAVASDQHGNVYLAKLFNDTLRKQGGYAFGNEDRTISHVLGMNKTMNKLTLAGRVLDWILDLLDPNHSIKSIGK
jgi:8-oxo-dGTP diphosphatase